jgi:predicted ArsR family transcriptional regulator
MKRFAPLRLNALCVAKMVRYMQDVPSSVHDLAEATGLATATTRKYVLALAKEKAIHVVDWEQDGLGRFTTKVYAFGQGKDVKRPPPVVSLADRRRQRAGRKRQMAVQNAIAGA